MTDADRQAICMLIARCLAETTTADGKELYATIGVMDAMDEFRRTGSIAPRRYEPDSKEGERS